MIATQQEMADARLDLAFRDHCAHLLIPLNTCRRKEFFMPYKCSHERHEYEKCQYYEYVTSAAACARPPAYPPVCPIPRHRLTAYALLDPLPVSCCRYKRRETLLKQGK